MFEKNDALNVTLGQALFGPRREKTMVSKNTGADQPAHPYSLISAFVFRFLERITSKLARSEISTILLVYVAEQAGLNLPLSEILKTGVLASRPI